MEVFGKKARGNQDGENFLIMRGKAAGEDKREELGNVCRGYTAELSQHGR